MMGRPRKRTTTANSSSSGGKATVKFIFLGFVSVGFDYVQMRYRQDGRLMLSPLSLTTTASIRPSTSLAFDQSFGFLDDLTDKDWKMRQEMARKHRHHDGNPLKYWNESVPASMFYFNNYEPLFSCPHLHRVGGPSDGPKWTCDPYRIKKVMVYDLLGPDVCEYHIFDPSNYDRPVNAKRNMHYHRWAIKSSYHKDPKSKITDPEGKRIQNMEFKSFPETLRLLGHENRTIDFLKVDCECCEWFSYRDWINYGDVRQLFVETHTLPFPHTVRNFWPWPGIDVKPTDFFDDLQNAGFIMFGKDPNIHADAKGNLVEWSFIKLHRNFLNGTV